MATLPAGFVLEQPEQLGGVQPSPQAAGGQLPPGFQIDAPQAVVQPQQPPVQQALATPQAQQAPAPDLGFLQPAAGGAAPSIPEDVSTRATRELPELGFGGLLAGEDPATTAKLTALIATTRDPNEIAQILKANVPSIGITQDEQGNLIATNNNTNVGVVINKPGLSPLDITQTSADIAAFTPAGLARTGVARVAGAAATEAGLQEAQRRAGGEFDVSDVALAGGTQALGEGVGLAKEFAQTAIPQAKQQLIDAARRFNTKLLTTDVVEPGTFFGRFLQGVGEKIPIAGTGGLRRQQVEQRTGAIKTLLSDLDVTPSPTIIFNSLNQKANKTLKAAGSRLGGIIDQLDPIGNVSISNTNNAIVNALGELTKPGKIKDAEAVKQLEGLISTLTEAPQSFGLLRENRTRFRDVVKAADGADRTQLPSFAKRLLEGIEKGITADLDSFVKSNLGMGGFRKYKQADQIYRREAVELTKSRLKNVLDKGEVTPESVMTLLFSNKPSENRLLFKNLDTEGRKSARSALIDKAIKDAGGIEDLSSPRFFNSIKRLEKQTSVFFRGGDKEALTGLVKLLRATKRAERAVSVPETGVQAVAALGLGSLMQDFGTSLATAGTVGALARAYETPLMRNFLIRLAQAKSARAQNQLLDSVLPIFNASLQAGRRSVQALLSESRTEEETQQLPQVGIR